VLYLSGVVRPDMPAMLSPAGHLRLPDPGVPWAIDNGRFTKPQDYTDDGYLALLGRFAPSAESCLFATAPDVVGDAAATLELSVTMLPRIRAAGYPVALVAQDGLEGLDVPWDDFDALFIGGTTEWKLGPGAAELAREARRRGKWVHMGRVNSLRRMRYAESIGCDSADGTYLKYRRGKGEGVGESEIAGWTEHVIANPSLWRPK
jgi:hypothetical protein